GPLSDAGITGWDPYTKPWWATLMQDPAFVAGVIARWQELRQGPLATDAMLAIINGVTPSIAAAATADFDQAGPWTAVKDHVKTWTTQRPAWVDANSGALAIPCTPSCDGRACGWDGCGGTCGGCGEGERCEVGACVAACEAPGCEVPPY